MTDEDSKRGGSGGESESDGVLLRGVPGWLPPAIYVFVALAATSLLIGHTFWGPECPTVDTTSLGLLALLLIVPLAPYITKLRAGQLEAEIGLEEVKRLRLQASELPGSPAEARTVPASDDGLGVVELTKRDPPLGLAKLRMDLEREVRRVYRAREPQMRRRSPSLGMMTRELGDQGVLPSEITRPLMDILGLANRAVHGEYVQREAAQEIAEIGVRVLETLEELNPERQDQADP